MTKLRILVLCFCYFTVALISYIITTVCLSVRPGADLGFRTSTDGQDQVLKLGSAGADRAGAGQGGRAGRQGQGRAARQKDLGNFRIWFSGLQISILGPGKF
jgi:hypothetical protein